ncbi:MAG: GGDEF domain-containing protein [Thermomicrobiales bacterium]|nr:GGDEF domain-containing protein [Thermomicrobiales bacterium]
MTHIANEPVNRGSRSLALLAPAAIASMLLLLRLLTSDEPLPGGSDAILTLTALGVTALSLIAALRAPGDLGRPWLLIAAGCIGWGYWYPMEAGASLRQDLLLNASYAMLAASTAAGAFLLCRVASDRDSRCKLLLDLLPPAIALMVAIWLFSVGPFVLDETVSNSMRLSAVIHGLGSALLLVIGAAGVLGDRRRHLDRSTGMLLIAIALLAVADAVWLQQLIGSLSRPLFATVAFGVAFLAMGGAAIVAIRQQGSHRSASPMRHHGDGGWQSQAPDVALGLLLLLAGEQAVVGERVPYGIITTIACAFGMLVFILLRQSIAMRRERTLRHEIGQLSEQIDGLISQVGRDPLTGLLNHRAIHERIDHELAAGRAGNYPVAVALIDVDNFKTINDTLGHQSGDRVLRAVGSILTAACRGTDVAARYAGDEFMLLLPGLNEVHAGGVCERIAQEVRRINDDLDLAQGVRVSLSVGVAVTHGCQRSVAQTVAIADAAMYDAKEGGKNRIVVVNADTLVISETHEPARTPDQLMAESRELLWSVGERRAG